MNAAPDDLRELAQELLDACYDPELDAYRGAIIELTQVTGSEGEDMGDWTIII